MRVLAVVVGILLALPCGASADHRPTMRDARAAARAAVKEHPTYRSIRSSSGLVIRSCRRLEHAVRCSLYRWAPTPCALDGSDEICIQVMTRRVWKVMVRTRDGRTVARVVRVTDTSRVPQSATA